MTATTPFAARRAWTSAASRAAQLQAPTASPSAGRAFLDGFMNASLLELGMCSPSRQARTARQAEPSRRYAAVYVTSLGAKRPSRTPAKVEQAVPVAR